MLVTVKRGIGNRWHKIYFASTSLIETTSLAAKRYPLSFRAISGVPIQSYHQRLPLLCRPHTSIISSARYQLKPFSHNCLFHIKVYLWKQLICVLCSLLSTRQCVSTSSNTKHRCCISRMPFYGAYLKHHECTAIPSISRPLTCYRLKSLRHTSQDAEGRAVIF